MLAKLTNHPIVKNSGIALIGFLVTGALGYGFQFFVSRRLSVAAYGEFQSLVALLGMLGVVSAALSYFVIAHTSVFAHHQDKHATYQFTAWLTRRLAPALLIVVAIFVLLSVPLQHTLHLSDPWGAMLIGGAAGLSISTVIYTGLFNGWQNFLAVHTLGALGALLKLIAAVAILSLWPTASSAAAVMLAATAGLWLLSAWWSTHTFHLGAAHAAPPQSAWRHKYFADRHPVKDIGFIIAFTFLTLYMQNADVLLVKHLAPADLAGHYSAFNLLGKIILWINLGVVATVLPIAVAQAHGNEPLRRSIRLLAYGILGMCSLGVIGIYMIIPELVITLTVGSKYFTYTNALWSVGLMNALLSLLLLEANFAFAQRDATSLYLLAAAAAAFAAGIVLSTPTITAVARSGILAFGLGGISMLFLNLRSSR